MGLKDRGVFYTKVASATKMADATFFITQLYERESTSLSGW